MVGRVTESFGLSVQEQQAQASTAAGSGEAQGAYTAAPPDDNSAAITIAKGAWNFVGGLKAKAKLQGQVDAFLGNVNPEKQGNWFSRIFTSEDYNKGVEAQHAQASIGQMQTDIMNASKKAAEQGVSPEAFASQTQERVKGAIARAAPNMDTSDVLKYIDQGANLIDQAGVAYIKQYTTYQKRRAEDTADVMYNNTVRSALIVQGDPERTRAVLRDGIEQMMNVPNLDALSPNYSGKNISQMVSTLSNMIPVGDAMGVRTVDALTKEVLDNPNIKRLPAGDQAKIFADVQGMGDKARTEHVALLTQELSGVQQNIKNGLGWGEDGERYYTEKVSEALRLPGLTQIQQGQIVRAFDAVADERMQFLNKEQKASKALGSVTSSEDANAFYKEVLKQAKTAGMDDLSATAVGVQALLQRTHTDSNPYTWDLVQKKSGELLESMVSRSGDTWPKDSNGNPMIQQPLQDWWQVLKGEWFKQREGQSNSFYQLTAGKPEYRAAIAKAMTDISANTSNQQILNFNHEVQNQRDTDFAYQAVPQEVAKEIIKTGDEEGRGVFQRWYDSARASAVNAVEFQRWFHAREGSTVQNVQLAQAFMEPANKAAKLEYIRDNFAALQGASPAAARDIVLSGITSNEVNAGVAMTSYASNSTLKAVPGFAQMSPEHRGAVVSVYGNAWEAAHPNDHLTAIRLVWNGDSIAVQGLPASAKNLDGAVHLGLITKDTVTQYNEKYFDNTANLSKSASYGTQVQVQPGASVVVQASGKNNLGVPGGVYASAVSEAIKVRGAVNPSIGQGDTDRLQQQELPQMVLSTVFPQARRLGVALSFDKGAPNGLGSLPSDEERRVFNLLVSTTTAAGPQATQKLVDLINSTRRNPATVDHKALEKSIEKLFPDNVPSSVIQNNILPYVFLAITRKHIQP